jgi:Holliday junction resolvase
MAKRVDANQKEIVTELRKLGYSVLILSMVGHGCPDILVGANNRNFLIEIKDDKKSKSQTKLTPDETEFIEKWKGNVAVCYTLSDILNLIKL